VFTGYQQPGQDDLRVLNNRGGSFRGESLAADETDR
jgi:hypothetical protein